MTPAGTSNELDVQNEWEENTHTVYYYNPILLCTKNIFVLFLSGAVPAWRLIFNVSVQHK